MNDTIERTTTEKLTEPCRQWANHWKVLKTWTGSDGRVMPKGLVSSERRTFPSKEARPLIFLQPSEAIMNAQPIELPTLIESSTLLGDLRDEILKRLRVMPKPWTVMSEAEQQDTIDSVERVARHLIVEATQLIAANGRPTIQAILEQCVFKEGIKAVVTMSKTAEQRHDLADAVGHMVLLVVVDHEQFMGEHGKAKPDPDQPTIPGSTDGSNVKNFKPAS